MKFATINQAALLLSTLSLLINKAKSPPPPHLISLSFGRFQDSLWYLLTTKEPLVELSLPLREVATLPAITNYSNMMGITTRSVEFTLQSNSSLCHLHHVFTASDSSFGQIHHRHASVTKSSLVVAACSSFQQVNQTLLIVDQAKPSNSIQPLLMPYLIFPTSNANSHHPDKQEPSAVYGNYILLDEALELAFVLVYLASYFVFLAFERVSKPDDDVLEDDEQSSFSFLYGIDDDIFVLSSETISFVPVSDPSNDFSFLYGIDDDDDDIAGFNIDCDDECNNVADTDSLCYSIDDDDDDLSPVFSLASTLPHCECSTTRFFIDDNDDDDSISVVSFESSTTMLFSAVVESSTPQLRRSSRIARMERVCYKRFY
jgi:hypothetical protein